MTLDRAGVFGGVDTHKDVHVAAAVDAAGRLLGTAEFAADSRGYDQLAGWLESWGAVGRVGVEGTGSYGAGLTRHLTAAGVEVVEVNRPNRQTRRRRGKTDTVDAETAARAALNGDATSVPKSADGCVEAIRTLSLARRSAVKARTVAANQINAVAVTAPEHLRDRLRGLKTPEMVKVCARWRIDAAGDPAAGAAKRALRALASRHRALTAEIKGLDTELLALCERANPALLGTCGVGAEAASALLRIRRGQPPADAQRSVVRRALRHQPHRGVIRAQGPPPAQPRRQPPSQQRPVAHRHRAAALRRAQHRLRRAPPSRGQDPTRDHPLPQAPHRTRDIPAAHRPAPGPTRRQPAPPAHPTRAHHRHRSPSPPHPHHPHLSTRTGPLPQPRPRRTLPTAPHPTRELTNIGASQFSAPTGPGSIFIAWPGALPRWREIATHGTRIA